MYHVVLRVSPKTRLCLRCTASCGDGQPCESQRSVCCNTSPSEGLYFTLRLLRLLMRPDAEVSGTMSWCERPMESECWCHDMALGCWQSLGCWESWH